MLQYLGAHTELFLSWKDIGFSNLKNWRNVTNNFSEANHVGSGGYGKVCLHSQIKLVHPANVCYKVF